MKKLIKRRAAALSLVLASTSIQALPVYINEFHYDNQGSDQGEFVEIGGLAGTDLAGWQLEFYNGGNGQRYMTWDLAGSISDQQQGYGVLAFSGSKGIQNGGSDGIALIGGDGALVQFLSYEGTLVASNGVAQGLTSVDVGVFESPSSSLASSLQLSGSGESSDDFIWQLGSATVGAFNHQQVYSFAAPPVLNMDPPVEYVDSPQLDVVQNPTVAVPEPTALSLFGLGLLALAGFRRKRA